MYNQDTAFGLKPVSNIAGGNYTRLQTFRIPATNVPKTYRGSIVKLTGTGSADGLYADVIAMAAADGGLPVGVVAGFSYDGAAPFDRKFIPTLTEAFVHVIVDPDAIYDVCVNTTLAAADIGLNADISSSTPIDGFGWPGFYLNAASKATTATLPLRILRKRNEPKNDVAQNFAVWQVKLNGNPYRQSTGA